MSRVWLISQPPGTVFYSMHSDKVDTLKKVANQKEKGEAMHDYVEDNEK